MAQEPFLRRAAPHLAYWYLTFVGATSRLTWLGREHVRQFEEKGKNVIYAFWHNRQVFFTYSHRDYPISVLVSRSQDGEIIARTMELSRIGAIRGSSSRAALTATRELLDVAETGRHLGLTPDGPRGPVFKVKPGILYAAQKTGMPIIPITNALSRVKVLGRAWDKFQVPLPFSRAWVVHGPPIWVREGDDLEAKAGELETSLNRITAEADRLARG
ncbi:MAG: lysophospholipid acyltransferase family protein [Elusimicrobia bacterium]|nr:lysophospholipid acyltransferase family protein [Elusimicrobiota bacterium]